MKNRFLHRCVAVAILLTSAAPPVLAQSTGSSKLDELLAAAHFYVVSYTVWPKNNEIRVCLSGKSRLQGLLTSVFSSRSSSQRRYLPVVLSAMSKPETECDAVILSNDSEENDQLINRLSAYPILTLSSEVDVTPQGGMVYLPQGKPPRILLERVKKSGLKVESSLLEISDIAK